MKYPFALYHLLQLLESYSEQGLPLDAHIYRYFRQHKALGSKDRAFIAEKAYGMIRWLRLIDHLLKAPPTWERRFELFSSLDLESCLKDESIRPAIRFSFPDLLFNLLEKSLGSRRARDFCLASNRPAPLTVRVNTLKISREQLLETWLREGLPVAPCAHSPCGIVFLKRMQLFSLPEFKRGYFEMQDEGSQLVAELVEARPGDLVLDYCAGAGGKALAIAPRLKGKGQLFLHDTRRQALIEAKKRLKRAGIQNAQCSLSLQQCKKKMDWVLVDAPCSGSGTLRRNPDMKWRFSEKMLFELIGKQRSIFERALSCLKPGGAIVYATCSCLQEENERQVERFCSLYGLKLQREPFSSLPGEGQMDGFFGAVLKP